MHRTPLVVCVLGLLSLSPTAKAVGQLADISLYDRDTHQSLPVDLHNGEYFVAGQPGNEYRIRVLNHGAGDLLSVISVDGVNVVSGETAHWRQSGYVVGSGDVLEVDGWRKSLSRTAAFYFTRLPDSYAARTGRPDNVGVIGVALFQRRPSPAVLEDGRWRANGADDSARRESAAAARAPTAPTAAASEAPSGRNEAKSADAATMPSERIGTGHGRSETSYARQTTFERATDLPAEVITIRYDSREHLVAMGILPEDRPLPVAVNPFPGAFVPDPPR